MSKLNPVQAGGDTGSSSSPLSFSLGEDMVCLDCRWTLYTGGMTKQGHASLGHRPLVKESEARPKAKKTPAKLTKASKVKKGSGSKLTGNGSKISVHLAPGGDWACPDCSWTRLTGSSLLAFLLSLSACVEVHQRACRMHQFWRCDRGLACLALTTLAGGMTEAAHESLGHKPLIASNTSVAPLR